VNHVPFSSGIKPKFSIRARIHNPAVPGNGAGEGNLIAVKKSGKLNL
jgi:hypothetical protein